MRRQGIPAVSQTRSHPFKMASGSKKRFCEPNSWQANLIANQRYSGKEHRDNFVATQYSGTTSKLFDQAQANSEEVAKSMDKKSFQKLSYQLVKQAVNLTRAEQNQLTASPAVDKQQTVINMRSSLLSGRFVPLFSLFVSLTRWNKKIPIRTNYRNNGRS